MPEVITRKPVPEIWYPKAIKTDTKTRMPSQGKHLDNFPKGAVIHYTAGWATKYKDGKEVPGAAPAKALDSIKGGIKKGFTYLCLAYDGTMIQAHSLTDWGYHAGASAWPGLRSSVHKDLVGIEICNAGKLDITLDKNKNPLKYVANFGQEIPIDQVRTVPARDNMAKGSYQKYSLAQELALIEFLIWCKQERPNVFMIKNVVGHDEVATPKGRKSDPGGSLSCTMPEFRALLMKEYIKRGGIDNEKTVAVEA